MTFVVLSDNEVEKLADMKSLILVIENAFKAKRDGNLICPPRYSVQFADEGNLVFTTGGITGNEHLAGFRVYDTFKGNSRNRSQLVAVWDSSSGEFKGAILGDKLGAIRTGAIGGVAIKHLSRSDAGIVGVIGTGLQAHMQLLAAATVRSLTQVRVFSRSSERRTTFACQMSQVLGIEVIQTDSARKAVLGADIVICATTSNTPVVESSWLATGAHINTIGPKFKNEHELGIDVAEQAGLIATDSLDQISSYSKPFFLKDTPYISKIVELADIITGNHPGRTAGEMRSLFCSVGLAGTEVLVANELFKSAS